MDSKKYEFAYILSPKVADEEALTWSGKLAKLIEDAEAIVSHQEVPQKRRLAYPIKKEKNGFFGWVTFSANPEKISAIEKKIKNEEYVLRHLIVEAVEVPLREPRPFIPRSGTSRPTKIPAVQPADSGKEEEKLDLEELDKKLEEILGK